MKDLAEFKQSLSAKTPPEGLSVYLKAMWLDGKGKWNDAHHVVDHLGDQTACWVHAYLHRKEGDLSNADYWYRNAGKKRPAISLDEEWEQIVISLLARETS